LLLLFVLLQHRVKLPGSCTALVAVVRPNGMLDVQMVGDCGLRLIRDGEVVLATEVGVSRKTGTAEQRRGSMA
jgi:hypothetical protein